MVVRVVSCEEPQLRRKADQAMSQNQTHFAQSVEPPSTQGKDVVTICGITIPNAQWYFAFDGEVCGRNLKKLMAEMELNSISVCLHCLNGEFTDRYLSAVRSSRGINFTEV
jgi:hypothetical protein